MILIDATNIKSGGGITLLDYLIKSFKQQNIEFILIINRKYNNKFSCKTIVYSGIYLLNRNKFLKKQINNYNPNCLFCFGNFPPSFKTKEVFVVTYMQNILYTLSFSKKWFSIKDNLFLILKYLYIKFNIHHTDAVCFQSQFVMDSFKSKFNLNNKELLNFPFYDFEVNNKQLLELTNSKIENGTFIYVSSSDPHKNHYKLLEAWELLSIDNLTPTLYLTLSENSSYTKKIIKKIEKLNKNGCKIVNLGLLSKEKLFSVMTNIEYCIYPTLIETIGLGLIEAVLLNKKILCSNIACLKEILEPSLTFDPNNSIDISKKVKYSLTHTLPCSKLIIQNNIQDFIYYLKNNSILYGLRNYNIKKNDTNQYI